MTFCLPLNMLCFRVCKIMEFGLRIEDMSFFVSCKLEIVIYKIVQVNITENLCFAFFLCCTEYTCIAKLFFFCS